ncbi:hypothetical protein [Afifella sp. YEN Y35]|uniref:hypothetical protein n=1 Tax=Afifella sp. YEN Y35 TaxID=3388337 RepID=UPI0039DFC150
MTWRAMSKLEKAAAVERAIAVGCGSAREIAMEVGAPSPASVVSVCRNLQIALPGVRASRNRTSARRFRSDLARLFALDRHVLVEAEVIDAEEEAWDRFREDPVRAALTLPDDRLFRLHRLLAEGRRS